MSNRKLLDSESVQPIDVIDLEGESDFTMSTLMKDKVSGQNTNQLIDLRKLDFATILLIDD